MKVLTEGECCSDCLAFMANGDEPNDLVGYVKRIAARWSADEIKNACASCNENCEGDFSWQPCEFCGSPRGGERHKFVILGNEASHD